MSSEDKSASQIQRDYDKYGSRYFKVDAGYDKRFYENDWKNYIRIIVTLIAFYICNSLHFWACFELGVTNTESAMWYNVAIFAATIVVTIGLMFSGRSANRKKAKYEFY